MHKDVAANDTVDDMNIMQLWVWVSKCHTCRKCQAIQVMAGWPSSAVKMDWAFYRII